MPRRKGISPVIATVIIVAVTIAVAIAVAFWMTGLIGLFTGTERLEIVSIDVDPTTNAWRLTIRVKNTGTVPVTIDGIYINGRLAASYDTNWQPVSGACEAMSGLSGDSRVNPGETKTISFQLSFGGNCAGAKLNPGVGIEVKLHSSGGKEYPKLVVLP
ncbi:MAG: hypothetical protein NZ954_01875 [Thermofilaceae archaeon]|nr:hypothetical protein [Thermofilaceae archaeon]MDW8003420.1 archaellin/type IV pilin N-terminal domain-containing protein [Thermofilaceae archaeon]